jgi:hypothetical protein
MPMSRKQKRALQHAARKTSVRKTAPKPPDTAHTTPPPPPPSPPGKSPWRLFAFGNVVAVIGLVAAIIGIYTLRTIITAAPSQSLSQSSPYWTLFVATNGGMLSLHDVNVNCVPQKLVFINGDSIVAPHILKTTADPVRSTLASNEQFTFQCGRAVSLFETSTEHVFVIGDASKPDSEILRMKWDASTNQPVMNNGKLPPFPKEHGPFKDLAFAREIPLFQADMVLNVKSRPPFKWWSSITPIRFISRRIHDGTTAWFPASLSDPTIPNHGAGLQLLLSSDRSELEGDGLIKQYNPK